MASIVLLDLMGGVALLLWGLHMVRSGIMRAFGSGLRRFLGTALQNRFLALLVGVGVTALLQSSTATGLLMTSFAARGLIELVPGLAVMLGANIGTTLIVQALSFDVSALAPVLFFLGILAFNVGGHTIARDLGRVAIGLGLMLLSLHILIDTLAPAETAPRVRIVLAAVTAEPVLCVVFAAAFTWAAHSSAAVVLLVMSLAYSHFVSPVAALALVLGANLGSAINPLLEGSRANLASRRLPVGNMLNRAVGVVLVLPFLQQITEIFARFDPNPTRMAADFHTFFNVALAAVFIFLLDGIARLLAWLLPEQAKQAQIILKTDERNLVLELGARGNSSSSQAVGMRNRSSLRATSSRSLKKNGRWMTTHLPAGRRQNRCQSNTTSRRSRWRVTVTAQRQSDVVT